MTLQTHKKLSLSKLRFLSFRLCLRQYFRLRFLLNFRFLSLTFFVPQQQTCLI
jgi:hypothetical protein